MHTVLEHDTETVYLSGVGGLPVHHPELESVTFLDDSLSARTIHVNRELGFTSPHDIIDAVHRAHEIQLQASRQLERESPDGRLTDADRDKLRKVFDDTLRSLSPAGKRDSEQQDQQKRDADAGNEQSGTPTTQNRGW